MIRWSAPFAVRPWVVGGLLALVACGGGSPSGPTIVGPPPGPAVLLAAGDIAMCGGSGPADTATLLDTVAGTVVTLGDNAYPVGSSADFQRCYEPTWGRHRSRTRPTPGNHDYDTPGAAGYFAYFGDSAGPAGQGYYTFRAGTWRVLSLNSNVAAFKGSAQYDWVRARLSEASGGCVAAMWHHPLVSSGPNGDNPQMHDIWRLLHEFKADLVLASHDHLYERFAPLNADGGPSPDGIRQFIVGTGGAELRSVRRVHAGSEVTASVHGVLKVTLQNGSYEWEFLSVPPSSFRDSGVQPCH